MAYARQPRQYWDSLVLRVGNSCSRGLSQHPDRRDDLTRRAVAALKRVVLDERALNRMQLTIGEPADGERVLRLPRATSWSGTSGIHVPAATVWPEWITRMS